jgi:predicted nicotinamide N-methyase
MRRARETGPPSAARRAGDERIGSNMGERDEKPEILETSAGDFRLLEYRFRGGGREWAVRHVGVILTEEDETRAIVRKTNHLPYGVSLWPSAIALAREVAGRADEFRGRRALELGAGTGLPGIVAASLGASVVQTDKDELVLRLARRNAEANAAAVEHRQADWENWDDPVRYDWILGADVLYGDSLRPCLRRIFEANLAPGGRVLLADPSRPGALAFLESLEADGWRMTSTRHDVGEGDARVPVGVHEATPGGAMVGSMGPR